MRGLKIRGLRPGRVDAYRVLGIACRPASGRWPCVIGQRDAYANLSSFVTIP